MAEDRPDRLLDQRPPAPYEHLSDAFDFSGAQVGGADRLQVPTDLATKIASAVLNFGAMNDGLDRYLAMLEAGLRLASANGKLPLVGDDVQKGADFIGDVRKKFQDALGSAAGISSLDTRAELAELMARGVNLLVLDADEPPRPGGDRGARDRARRVRRHPCRGLTRPAFPRGRRANEVNRAVKTPDARVSRARGPIWRVWAAPGSAFRPLRGLPAEPSAPRRRATTDAAGIGGVPPTRPRAASSGREAGDHRPSGVWLYPPPLMAIPEKKTSKAPATSGARSTASTRRASTSARPAISQAAASRLPDLQDVQGPRDRAAPHPGSVGLARIAVDAMGGDRAPEE